MFTRLPKKNLMLAFADKVSRRGHFTCPILLKLFSSSANQGRANNTNYSAIVSRADTTIASSWRWDDSSTMEDRFHLSKIFDVKKIFLILKQHNYGFPLNDMVHFLRRIVELNDEKQLKLTTKNSVELSSFINEIKKNLRQATQEYPLIGSYAWCFWKLSLYEDSELWLTLGDYIIDERFSPNFNESLCGIEGFTALDGIADQQFIDAVYKRLEKVLVLTILEVDIAHYKRITESLIKVHRFTRYVFENIEQHLMHFLNSHEIEYDLGNMLDILSTFAFSGNGSQRLFYSFEHIFVTFYDLPLEQQIKLCQGNFISKLVSTYALAKTIQPDLVYDPAFYKLVYQFVMAEEATYTLEELVNVIQNIGAFEYPQLKEINQLLDQRIFQVKGDMKGDDMVRYIDLKVGRDHAGEYSQLPKEVMTFFDDYLNKNMEKQAHHHIYFYITEIEDRKLMENKKEFLNHLISYVGNKLHIYDFEELCYFYWLFNKYVTEINMDSAKIQCDLSSIKDHIRLHSAFSKGRLRIGSNFYKMLEVVSGSDFLSQGEYPEW